MLDECFPKERLGYRSHPALDNPCPVKGLLPNEQIESIQPFSKISQVTPEKQEMWYKWSEEIQHWLFETDSTGAFNHLFPLDAVLSLLERTGGVAFSLKEYLPLSPSFGDFKWLAGSPSVKEIARRWKPSRLSGGRWRSNKYVRRQDRGS